MTKLFTEEEVIQLCQAIRSHPSLYDPADPNFGKSLPNKLVWENIAKQFDKKSFTADDVKLKWKNLRDTMALLLRKSNRDPNTWRFYEHCRFLNNYERPQRRNRKSQPSQPQTKPDDSDAKRIKLTPDQPPPQPAPQFHNSNMNLMKMINPDNSNESLLSSLQHRLSSQSLLLPTTTTVMSTLPMPQPQRPVATVMAAKEEEVSPPLRHLTDQSPPLCAEDSSSREPFFDDASRDSILQHLASQNPSLLATPLNHNHLPRLSSSNTNTNSFVNSSQGSTSSRDLYDVFGEETAMRLRAIDSSGDRALFLKARRIINNALEEAEMEMHNRNRQH
ncbi:unnamed protein product [Bursaphelenchus okinawaensis]|uniref:MADF domain-containing protein n=1 Tax=Bursaphelenchus okinawaensis TaxID=465554 RepID=A0A811L9N5_9BILA|nr:unnamed protein product [Bursaphelenchus okinawaensis]CAG9119854.1 unnamed protein product [Bursaphelenchus okinawaensis]